MRAFLSPRAGLAALCLVLLLNACDGERTPLAPPSPVTPSALRIVEGDGQEGAAGEALPAELTVKVLDAPGGGMQGVDVAFAVVAGGGRVATERVATDALGRARTRWTLGTVAADSQVVEARVQGLPPVRLRAFARAGAPASVAVTAGNGAAGPVGAPLPDSLAVTVRDRHGNPVVGLDAAWSVTAGGGTVSPAGAVTGPGGTARTQWTLGPRADSVQGALVRVGDLEPVAFTAHAVTAGVPLQLAKRGGDGQRGPAGGVLADSLAVVLRMPDGRPVQGALVTWQAPPEAGVVLPAVSRTDAGGAAAAAWRLGTSPGLVQATATVDAGTLVFTALVQADAPARMEAAGGGGEGPVGGPLSDSLAVRVTDRFGNPVPGAEVAWSATAGGGEVHPPRSVTDGRGMARAQWTLGPRVGPPGQAATATLPGLPPVAFHATASTAGVPLVLARVAGDGQTGAAGRALADSLAVQLRTQAGVPVHGAAVAWVALSGGGRVSPAASRTDAQGMAYAAWTMGTTTGPVLASARVDEGALAFSATATAGPPATVSVVRGDGQSATRGTILPDSLVVRVADAYGNPVQGAQVQWGAEMGRGHLEQRTSATGANGTARTRWAVGFTPGPNVATAWVEGAAPARFAATALPGELRLRGLSRVGMAPDGMSSFRLSGYQSAYVTDLRGRRAIGAAIEWEAFRMRTPAPASEWDTSSVQLVDRVWFGAYELPLPYWVAHFEEQRVVVYALSYYTFFGREVELPGGPGPYTVNDTVEVVPRMVYYGRGPNYGWPSYAEFRLYDDNGWSGTAHMWKNAMWPVGTRSGTRRLTICLPEPYTFPEECEDTTIVVNP